MLLGKWAGACFLLALFLGVWAERWPSNPDYVNCRPFDEFSHRIASVALIDNLECRVLLRGIAAIGKIFTRKYYYRFERDASIEWQIMRVCIYTVKPRGLVPEIELYSSPSYIDPATTQIDSM